jgi:hypothetical protein
MSMYRAVLVPTIGDKTEQAICRDLNQAKEWARKTLESKYPNLTAEAAKSMPVSRRPRVNIWEQTETLVIEIGPQ